MRGICFLDKVGEPKLGATTSADLTKHMHWLPSLPDTKKRIQRDVTFGSLSKQGLFLTVTGKDVKQC